MILMKPFSLHTRTDIAPKRLKVKDDITRALDKNHAVFLIMLDLSAAFDTIDHDILFNQFEHVYGVKGTTLQWFKSYMTGRSFKVSISGENFL